MSRYKSPSSTSTNGKNTDNLLGILATVESAWKSGNANINYMTDGNDATSNSGVVAGVGNHKCWAFDLGSEMTINSVTGKFGTIQGEIRIFVGLDAPSFSNGTPTNMTMLNPIEATESNATRGVTVYAIIRYLVLRCQSTATDCTYQIYTISAWS